ncbi:type II toxin-antitoxin system HipA family toxin [Isoptericola halotolerans]|uniref:type II toxin-antitoxin system HipA family toxin n=1 Tax=Isoptericola halotolerans TaxID=300560 RepID=UPI00388EE464
MAGSTRGGREYPGRQVDPYLLGLLPDDASVRGRWGAQWDVSASNPFALLEHMGRDCAGAVEFVPEGDAGRNKGDVVPLSEGEIGARLRALAGDAAGWAVGGERWSLAGAQSEFALVRRDGSWFEATGAEPSTHIVKPGVAGYQDQALNEHVCLRAAAFVGLRVAPSEVLEFDGVPALVVTRYDRRRDAEGRVIRVHQEDICQALSVYPHRRYEASGGPTAVDVVRLIRETATDSATDIDRFVRALVFNYLVGAPDAHAKNCSVLLAGSQVRLAPLYDVASGLPYEPTRQDHELHRAAMGIGGEKRFGRVTGRHWDKFSSQARLDPDHVHGIVRELSQTIPDALDRAVEPHRGSGLRDRLIPRVDRLCATTLRDL